MAIPILVTPRSLTAQPHHPALENLRSAGYALRFCQAGAIPDHAQLQTLLPGCRGWLAGVEPIDDVILDLGPDLRVISRNGAGVDNIDLAAAARRGIAVCRADGANARAVAELTACLMLLLVRRMHQPAARLAAGDWARGRPGRELAGLHLGLIGLGRVGGLVAELALAFGMRVSACDPALDHAPAPASTPDARVRRLDLDQLLVAVDGISLHCPHQPGAPPLIDTAALSRLRPGAWLVNTARAGLVDQTAVVDALDRGQLSGYAVDVFDPEPPLDFTLCQRPDVIASPHLGGYTRESIDRATRAAVEHLLRELGSGH